VSLRVVVIGGGVIGRAAAVRLLDAGNRVTLLDQPSDRLHASQGNAGHIGIEQTAPLSSWSTIRSLPNRLYGKSGVLALPLNGAGSWLPWGLRFLRASSPRRFEAGRAAMTELLSEAITAWRKLLAIAGAPELLVQSGHFILCESSRSLNSMIKDLQHEPAGQAIWAPLTADRLKAIADPLKVPFVGGVGYVNTGQIASLGRMMQALADTIQAKGGEMLAVRAAAVLPVGRGARVQLHDAPPIDADIALVTAGVESGALLRPLGYSVPLIAERGYHLETDLPPGPTAPPILFFDRSVVCTKFTSSIRVTSVTEFTRHDAPPDPRHWQRLLRHVRELGLPFGEQPRQWHGSRPSLPDFLPAIGRLERWPQIAYAFGHHHAGLTLAGQTAELVVRTLEGTAALHGPPALRIERFT